MTPDGWVDVHVSDVADVVGGATPSTADPDNFDGEVPWLTPKDLSGFSGRYVSRGARNLSEKGLQASGARRLPTGTVLVSSRAPVGYVAIANGALSTNQGFRSLVLRDGQLPEYWLYLLRMHRPALEQAATGSTFRELNGATFKNLSFVIPPQEEQRRIAGVLGALDDKIEHNAAHGARLLALARLEFERWFRSMSDVPRVRVADLISAGQLVVNDGYRAKNSEMAAEGVPFLRGGNVNGDLELAAADLLGQDAVARAGDKVSRIGDAFFTAKGTVGRLGRVTRWTPRFVYSPQIAFWRSLDEDVLAPEYIYLWLGSKDFIEQRDAVKGQTDMADYVNLRDQREMTIVITQPERQRELTSAARPLLDNEALARAESRRLAAIRDALLPKLVSGAVRVPDSYDPTDSLGTVAEAAGAAVP